MTRKTKLEKALAFDEKQTMDDMSMLYDYGGRSENRRLKPLHAALLEAVEALEMGAFHHPSCGWYDGKDCHCANSKCKEALSKIDKVLGGGALQIEDEDFS